MPIRPDDASSAFCGTARFSVFSSVASSPLALFFLFDFVVVLFGHEPIRQCPTLPIRYTQQSQLSHP